MKYLWPDHVLVLIQNICGNTVKSTYRAPPLQIICTLAPLTLFNLAYTVKCTSYRMQAIGIYPIADSISEQLYYLPPLVLNCQV